MLAAWIVLFTTALFAYFVVRQAFQRMRPHNLVWGISLVLSVFGTLFYLLALQASPPSAAYFRLYYICGALLMPAYMGLGSLYLSASRRFAHAMAALVVLGSVVGSVLVWRAPLDAAALAQLAGGPGTGILRPGAWLVVLIVMNTFGVVALVAVALLSAWRAWQRRSPLGFALGNGAIAVGGLTLGGAGAAARLGWPQAFWLVMALGWVITFVGFMIVTAQAEAMRQARRAPNM